MRPGSKVHLLEKKKKERKKETDTTMGINH
jgi:hypothetical protein